MALVSTSTTFRARIVERLRGGLQPVQEIISQIATMD
jgi:hypothetical protein